MSEEVVTEKSAVVNAAREEQLRREFTEAARDPMFLTDQLEAMRDYAAADAETAKSIPSDDWDVYSRSGPGFRKREDRANESPVTGP